MSREKKTSIVSKGKVTGSMYYAKSKRKDGSQPTVTEHIDAVSECAATYGEEVGMREQARIVGLAHDLGKYSEQFQKVLSHEAQNIDHAAGSAALLYFLWKKKPTKAQMAVIEAVNGHHAGLSSFGEINSKLRDSFLGSRPVTVNDGKTPALNGIEEYKNACECFRNDHPNEQLTVPKWNLPDDAGNLETMLYSRMLLSCLADADYSVSAQEDDKTYFEATQSPKLDADECLNKLYQFRDQIRKNSEANTVVDDIRNQVFEICGDCGARQPGGLFTLTAPTGTGKTLALLHFALRHAKATGKRRIIVVLPFLTLIEQNAKVYEKVMPSVLEDHSQNRLQDEMREFVSKWNMPFIITTSVKFFESLFANEPTDCRKLHNLAQSVVVFDEAQSLPPHLVGATLKAINELCTRYQMTMVFSTATQPNFEAISNVSWKPTEILPNHAQYYEKLRRVKVNWQLNERITLSDLARQMLEKDNVCAIFNLRRHAREVFERLFEEDPDSAFLISTDLCPAHRIQVVNTIRQRLKDKKPCRVAATQCIEAGVDLDFMFLYRALAPLDAIIQAAGRCNRNGNQEAGQVTVFIPNDKRLYPDDWYGSAAEIVSRIAQCSGIDINDPNHIRRYYAELFADANDRQELTKAIYSRDFSKVDKEYRLIENNGKKLIVPYTEMISQYNYICDEIREKGITPTLMKEAAPVTITLYDSENMEQFAEPIVFRRRSNKEYIESGYLILREQYRCCYTENGGFKLPDASKNNWNTIF